MMNIEAGLVKKWSMLPTSADGRIQPCWHDRRLSWHTSSSLRQFPVVELRPQKNCGYFGVGTL
eukprot:2660449-Amphidinium_carterae.1